MNWWLVQDKMKYCGHCGMQVNKKDKKCPNCKNSIEIRDNKKKILLFIFIIGLICILLACGGVIIYSFVNTSDLDLFDINESNADYEVNLQKIDRIFTNEYGTYFICEDALVLKNDDNTLENVLVYENLDSDKFSLECFDPNNSICDGKFIYSQCTHHDKCRNLLYKYEFVDKTKLKKSLWKGKIDLLQASLWNEKYNKCIYNFLNWKTDGEYIYFCSDGHIAYVNNDNYSNYRIFRTKIGSSKIEMVGDGHAVTFSINKGWIYYYDNGYSDKNRKCGVNTTGIFKMKLDGSNKTLICEKQGDNEETYDYELCTKFSVLDGYLYFIDSSAEGKGRLFRMNLDTESMEPVSSTQITSYYIDADNGIAYYNTVSVSSLYRNYCDLIFCDIATKRETKFIDENLDDRYDSFVLYNEEFYFFTDYGVSATDIGREVCMKYNDKNHTFENMIGKLRYNKKLINNQSWKITLAGADYYWETKK